jgi:hypothetical protein
MDPDYQEWRKLERLAAEVEQSMQTVAPRLQELRRIFAKATVRDGQVYRYRGTTFRVVK